MTDEASAGPPPDRETRLRALELARGVAFRHLVARLRPEIVTALDCRLTAIHAEGGSVELQALSDRGLQSFAELGATAAVGQRRWFPLLHVVTLVAKRKGEAAPPPLGDDQGTP